MAIAGIVVTGMPEDMERVRKMLEATPGAGQITATEDVCKLAAVLECPSENMNDRLSRLKDREGVLAVDLAFLNYEDDLADRGAIVCPPHTPHVRKPC